jgi:hypothetical protein
MVNLPIANPAGRIAMTLLDSDYVVDLEITASQNEGRGEVVSAPRVITANGKEAVIEQGQEIPYQESSSSGATTTQFKKAPPYIVGVSAGYLSNSWVVFALQHIRYEASLHKEISNVIVTDAAFNPTKQVADIEDLISKNVSMIPSTKPQSPMRFVMNAFFAASLASLRSK